MNKRASKGGANEGGTERGKERKSLHWVYVSSDSRLGFLRRFMTAVIGHLVMKDIDCPVASRLDVK